MKHYNTLIAIDPGSNGGIVLYNSRTNHYSVHKMMDNLEFSNMIDSLREAENKVLVCIEKVQSFNTDTQHGGKRYNIDKLLKNFNQLCSILESKETDYLTIPPITWQKTLGLTFPKGKGFKKLTKDERKRFYKNWIAEKHPDLKVYLWNSDALCIMRALRWNMYYRPDWVKMKIDNK